MHFSQNLKDYSNFFLTKKLKVFIIKDICCHNHDISTTNEFATMPLEFSTTGEPFIRLDEPSLCNIIITPLRQTDGPSNLKILNDPAVYKNITTPFPYTEADWEAWFSIASKAESVALKEYLAAEDARKKGEASRWVGSETLVSQPVTAIREVDEETGKEELLGSISIRRGGFLHIRDEVERKRLKELNDGLEAGNPAIQWEMGCKSTSFCLL